MGSFRHRVLLCEPSGLETETLSFHFPLSTYLVSPSAPTSSPETSQRPVPNTEHSLNLMSAFCFVFRLFTCMSPNVSIHVLPTMMLFTRDAGGPMLYTSPVSLSAMRVRPLGQTSTQLPMNFVRAADVRSYVHFAVVQWPAPTGGWWHTCSETYVPAPFGSWNSHVSPSRGLNGFFVRSQLEYVLMASAQMYARRMSSSASSAAASRSAAYCRISDIFCSIVVGSMMNTGTDSLDITSAPIRSLSWLHSALRSVASSPPVPAPEPSSLVSKSAGSSTPAM
mmetsp:Transcript_211/g.835  ORF Transcript_211/g.835 Transcript_211/m.835 type:complete len:280 (+) Transcript_211:568-1407(+)